MITVNTNAAKAALAESRQLAASITPQRFVPAAKLRRAQAYENEQAAQEMIVILQNWEAGGFKRLAWKWETMAMTKASLKAKLYGSLRWIKESCEDEAIRKLAATVGFSEIDGGFAIKRIDVAKAGSLAAFEILPDDVEIPAMAEIKKEFIEFMSDAPVGTVFERPDSIEKEINLTGAEMEWFREQMAQVPGLAGKVEQRRVKIVKLPVEDSNE